jgi:hypothetical protein
MDLRDATLMFLSESAAYPAVASIAQSAYDRLVEDEAFEAMIGPILQEISRNKPIQSQRPPAAPEDDPLTAPVWPPAS